MTYPTRTALLIGGVRDGDTMTVRADQGDIVVYEFHDAGIGYSPHFYQRHVLLVLGSLFPVWVHTGIALNQRDVVARQYLLSDLALKLTKESRELAKVPVMTEENTP